MNKVVDMVQMVGWPKDVSLDVDLDVVKREGALENMFFGKIPANIQLSGCWSQMGGWNIQTSSLMHKPGYRGDGCMDNTNELPHWDIGEGGEKSACRLG